jgi:twinkle protein
LTPNVDRLLEVCEYGFRRYGIEVFIIDSLTVLSGQQDYEDQQRVMEKFVTFKLNFNCTVFMLTHSRKGESEHKAMDKYDVKGSGAITDLADSVLSLWKNKKKADHINECRQQGMPTDPDITDKPDIVLQVLKNRHGLYEGKCGLWFCTTTCQYLEDRDAVALPFTTNREEPF